MLKLVGLMSLLTAAAAFALPNPAAVHCVKQGGKNVIITSATDGSQSGLCRFGGGGVGDWTLYRLHHGSAQQAVTAFLGRPDLPLNTGAISPWLCQDLGGQKENYREGSRPLVVCAFPDQSTVELAVLNGGPQRYPELADALTN